MITTGLLIPKLNIMFGIEGWRYSWLILGAITLCFGVFCGLAIRTHSEDKVAFNTSSRVMELGLVRAPLIWKIGLVYFMFGLSYIIYVTFFGAYLVNEIGLTSQKAGFLWAMVGGLSLVSGPIWGHISDRAGRRHRLAFVYLIHALSFFLFFWGKTEASFNASAILFGVTAWSIPSIIAAYSGDHFEPRVSFSALGFLTLSFGIGQALGPSTAGYIADRFQTFSFFFLLSSMVAVIGGLLSLKLLKE